MQVKDTLKMTNVSKATLVARANGSGYDYHTDGTGKEVWEMTKSKKILTKVLNKPPKGCDKRLIGCATTWDAIITGTNIEFGEDCNFPGQLPDMFRSIRGSVLKYFVIISI